MLLPVSFCGSREDYRFHDIPITCYSPGQYNSSHLAGPKLTKQPALPPLGPSALGVRHSDFFLHLCSSEHSQPWIKKTRSHLDNYATGREKSRQTGKLLLPGKHLEKEMASVGLDQYNTTTCCVHFIIHSSEHPMRVKEYVTRARPQE